MGDLFLKEKSDERKCLNSILLARVLFRPMAPPLLPDASGAGEAIGSLVTRRTSKADKRGR